MKWSKTVSLPGYHPTRGWSLHLDGRVWCHALKHYEIPETWMDRYIGPHPGDLVTQLCTRLST